MAGVLLLHGGTDDPRRAGEPLRLSWWSVRVGSIPRLAKGIDDRLRPHDIATWTLQHRLAGWDGPADPTPVREARAALDRIAATYPGLPVVLVGHSMGGRTAVCAADHPSVVGVVGLAPWLPPEQPASPLAGKPLRVAYAEWDRVCPRAEMEEFLTAATSVCVDVRTTSMGRDVHVMLAARRWCDYVADQVRSLVSD